MSDREAGVAGADGPGARLRLAREQRGLSEQQAAERLTLDVGVIMALERDDFAALGAGVFAKGHLRRYAVLLGLDDGEMLAAYERSQAHLAPPSLIPRARAEMVPERSQVNWPWVAGGVTAVLVAAGLVAYVSEYGLRLPWGAAGEPEIAAATAEAMPADVGPGTSAGDVTGVDSAGPATTTGDAPPASGPDAPLQDLAPGQISVSIAFAADSWTEIYDRSGTAVLYDVGKAGTRRTLAAAAPLSVTFGNAPAITLLVNGRATALPAVPEGQTVARFSISPDGSVRGP